MGAAVRLALGIQDENGNVDQERLEEVINQQNQAFQLKHSNRLKSEEEKLKSKFEASAPASFDEPVKALPSGIKETEFPAAPVAN